MLPSEFWNSTYRNIKIFVQSKAEKETDDYKRQIILYENTTNKLIGAFAGKHPQNKSLVKDFFKELFEDDLNKESNEVMTPEEIIKSMKSRM